MTEEPTQGREDRLTGGQLAWLVAALVVGRLLWSGAFPIYDDAFITYRYARNLVATGALIYNPGAAWEPVLGTTAPGYALVLSGLHALGLGLIPASLGLNVAAEALAAVLIARLLGRELVTTTVALFTFATLPDLARISVGGMEAPVLATLALGAVDARRVGRPVVAGTCAALACSFRPESVLLIGFLGLGYLRDRRALGRFLAPVAAVGIVHAVWLTLVYGSPIPQSVTAKAARHTVEVELQRVRDVLRLAFVPRTAMWIALPFVAFGLVRVLRAQRPLRPFVLFGLGIVAAYLIARPKTWGWYYYVPLCTWVLGLAFGLASWQPNPRLARARGLVPSLVIVAVAVSGGFALLRPDRVTDAVYGEIEAWTDEEDVVERGATILASDIGAFGWYADTRILDSQGLVWPEAVEHPNQMDIARTLAPEYVVLVANRARVGAFYEATDLHDRYEARWRFNATGDHELAPELDSLPDGWAQDYIVLERVDAAGAPRAEVAR